MAGRPPWPETLRLERAATEGARAQGLTLPRALLAERAAQLAARSREDVRLQLCLSGEEAVIWSAEPADLPWFPRGAAYLGAPERRIFTPIGLRIATPAVLLPALLAELERRHDVAPPLLARPADPDRPTGPVTILDLRRSVPLADVDWRRLEAMGR